MATGEAIEKEFGIPIVNKRISVTPMAIAGAACKSEDFVPLALTLDRAAKTCGVNYGEIFFSDSETDDHWYKAKLSFIIIDEKTGKEKRSAVNFLVQAANFNAAVKNIEDSMDKTAIDYVIVNISETKIMDVFEHNAPVKKEEKNDKPEFEG